MEPWWTWAALHPPFAGVSAPVEMPSFFKLLGELPLGELGSDSPTKSQFPQLQAQVAKLGYLFLSQCGVSRFPRWPFPVAPACQCRSLRLDPRVGKSPWRRARQPTPVFSPGKSHGQRSLAGYSGS